MEMVVGLLLLIMIGSSVIFSAIFATIDYAARGKHWGLSFGRTLLTTMGFAVFIIALSIVFEDNAFYW